MMGTVPQRCNHDGNCASDVTMMVTMPQVTMMGTVLQVTMMGTVPQRCNHDGNCASEM